MSLNIDPSRQLEMKHLNIFRQIYGCPYTLRICDNERIEVDWSSKWFQNHNQVLPFLHEWKKGLYLHILVKNLDL